MTKQYQLQHDGQAVLQDDYNGLGAAAARGEDYVFAELLRMVPYNGSSAAKGIIPYGYTGSGNTALISPNGASGSVAINPFRAFVGSRTAVGTSGQLNWQDVRTAISVGATTLHNVVNLAANSSGNPRWDAIYATVSVAAASTPELRKVKNPGTGVVTDVSVSVYTETRVVVDKVTGTPAGAPTQPAIPADSGSNYYILLGYVLVPNGFGAASTVDTGHIETLAPCLSVSPTSGALSGSLASSMKTLTTTQRDSWATLGLRPDNIFPTNMVGGETVWAVLDLTSASSASHSHAVGGVIDDRDWRGRFCSYIIRVGASTQKGSWIDGSPTIGLIEPNGNPQLDTAIDNQVLVGIGQTQIVNAASPANASIVAHVDVNATNAAAGFVYIYCDHADGGKLKLHWTTNPRTLLICRLDFSGRYENIR